MFNQNVYTPPNKGRTATLIVAASNSSAKSKQGADYVCDGTDDHLEIQAAIDVVNADGGGTVSLTNGSFILGHGANKYSTWYTSLEMKSNVNLRGNNSLLQIQATPSQNFILIYGNAVTDCEISGLILDGISSTKGQAATLFQGNFERVRITNNYIKNMYLYGVWWDNTGVSNGWITNNFVTNVQAFGLSVHNAPKRCVVAGNIIYNASGNGRGIMIDTANAVSCYGNIVNMANGDALYLYDGVVGCTFLGNQLKSTSQNSINLYDDGVKTVSSNNTFIGNQCNGAVVISGTNNLFSGNRMSTTVTNNGTGTIFKNNLGYLTENKGVTAVADDTTSVDVAHGLSKTPVAQDIVVTPTNNLGDASFYWISDVGATTFRINVDSDPGASTATFAWQIN